MRRTVFALSLLSTLTACDVQDPGYDLQLGLAPPPDAPAPGEGAIDFREQGPPAALYITTVGGKPIHKAEFASLVNACWKVGDPPLTCTLSWYQPDVTVSTEFVLGLGCSEVASQAILDCYRTLFKNNGGKAI